MDLHGNAALSWSGRRELARRVVASCQPAGCRACVELRRDHEIGAR